MAKDYPGAFAALRRILSKHGRGLTVLTDTPTEYTLTSAALGPNGKPLWFGCVLSKKSAVTYHLMPLYYNPRLLAEIPPELEARKQGKTCFNFQRPDPDLFAKLERLTRLGRQQWERAGMLELGPVAPERLNAALRAGGADPKDLAKRRRKAISRRVKGAAARRGP